MFVAKDITKCNEEWRDTWVRVEYRNLCPQKTKTVAMKSDDDEFEELLSEHETEKGILFFEKKTLLVFTLFVSFRVMVN